MNVRFARVRWHFVALLAGLVLSIIHAWPLFGARTSFPSTEVPREDVLMNMWHIHWFQVVLSHLRNPFRTDLLAAPLGATFFWHTLSPAKTLPGALLAWGIGPLAAYNAMVFSTFVLSYFTTWLMVRQVLRDSGTKESVAAIAALMGASVFAFSRYHFAQALSHLNLVSIEGIPLYIYFWLRVLKNGERRDFVGLALTALYTALCDYYYLMYLAIFSVLWLALERAPRGGLAALRAIGDRVVLRAIVAGVAVALVVSPIALMLATHRNPPLIGVHHGDTDYPADLLTLLLPDKHSFAFRFLSADIQSRIQAVGTHLYNWNSEEGGAYLGLVTLVAALAVGGATMPRLVRNLLGVGACFVLLSTGKHLTANGTTHLSSWIPLGMLSVGAFGIAGRRGGAWRDLGVLLLLAAAVDYFIGFTAEGQPFTTEVPMPFMIAKSIIPFFSKGGMPVRMAMMFGLGVSAALGWACARLLEIGKAWGYVAAVALAVVPNVELAAKWHMVQPPPREPFESFFAGEPADFRVISDDNILAEYDQIFHGHPVSYARLSRVPQPIADQEHTPAFRALASCERLPDGWSDADVRQIRAYLAENHFRFYTYHPSHYVWGDRGEAAAERVAAFMKRLGAELVHRDGYVHVYRLPKT